MRLKEKVRYFDLYLIILRPMLTARNFDYNVSLNCIERQHKKLEACDIQMLSENLVYAVVLEKRLISCKMY